LFPPVNLQPADRRNSQSPTAKNEKVIQVAHQSASPLSSLAVKKQDSASSNLSRLKSRVSGCLQEFKTLDSAFTHVQGDVLLKTQSNSYKQRFIILMGNELYFQKQANSESHEFMHLLFGTFIEIKEGFEHKFSEE